MVLRGCRPHTCMLWLKLCSTLTWQAISFWVAIVPLGRPSQKRWSPVLTEHPLCAGREQWLALSLKNFWPGGSGRKQRQGTHEMRWSSRATGWGTREETDKARILGRKGLTTLDLEREPWKYTVSKQDNLCKCMDDRAWVRVIVQFCWNTAC